ncbi:hypothetical protein GCM10010451_17230 [Streptomyces virens]|uniref:Uncharacterized protein n=1 Tax=Streptomyces virens TaxID=285572 RepID=A0ABP6P6F2_9ACTN
MIIAMPRPAAETAEQTVSAIIRSSRAACGRDGRFVPSILHLPYPAGPCSGRHIRDISGSAHPQVEVEVGAGRGRRAHRSGQNPGFGDGKTGAPGRRKERDPYGSSPGSTGSTWPCGRCPGGGSARPDWVVRGPAGRLEG